MVDIFLFDTSSSEIVLRDTTIPTPPPPSGGLNYWNGSAWTTSTIKYWDGAVWQTSGIAKYWNGASWINV